MPAHSSSLSHSRTLALALFACAASSPLSRTRRQLPSAAVHLPPSACFCSPASHRILRTANRRALPARTDGAATGADAASCPTPCPTWHVNSGQATTTFAPPVARCCFAFLPFRRPPEAQPIRASAQCRTGAPSERPEHLAAGPGILDAGLACAAAAAGLGRWRRCMIGHPGRFCRSSPSSSPPPSPLPVPALDDLPSPSDQSQDLPGPLPPPSAPSAAAVLLFFAFAAFFPRSSHSSLVRRPAHDALRQQSSRLPSARVRIFSTAEPRNISRPSVSSHSPRRASVSSSSQSSRHEPQTAQTPPAACPGLDCDIPPAPAYDAAAPLSTQAAVPSQANHLAPVGPTAFDHIAHKIEALEEEPYTIKCICNFSDDDGNTIYCETCDTWQHIDCFYPENREEAIREDFSHSCADCQPRPLNRQKAIERTLRLRTSIVEPESIDKKPKRLPSKSHKKKKPSDAHFNGIHGPLEGGKHGHNGDHHPTPAKKPKTSHRPSLSVSSQPSKRSPSYGNNRTNPTHPPSPATTPPDLPDDFTIHHYSEGFCSLYNDVPDRQNNGFASLAIPTALMRWLDSSSALEKEVGRRRSEIFQDALPALERKRPKLEVKDATQSLDNGTTLRWRSLKSTSSIEKDVPLIELNGEIGFQKDYCAEGDNLWGDISSPLPFVFFHPILPLYIDTRKEGSIARFARRSCKPNAQLDTFLTGGSEYHFWLVSDRYIPPNEQITLPWDFRLEKSVCQRWLHLLGLSDDDSAVQDEFELDESEYTAISNWIDRILSEYGGCACDQDNNCAFARFHRHYLYGKSQSRRKRRKPKAHTISPTSTGHATNSRAASEGHLDDQADREGRDGSVAARSKPSSRDRTPLRQGSFDQLGILTEPTDRDKRKVAMVEDTFRRMEQEQQQPARKKKRLSDGTTVSTSSKAKSRTGSTPHIGSYADAGTTARSKSGSPASSRSPNLGTQTKPSASHREPSEAAHRQSSASPRPLYCDMGIQTDPVEDEWFSALQNIPCRKKKIIPLSRRLLNSRYKARAEEERKRSTPSRPSSVDAMDVDATAAEQELKEQPAKGEPAKEELTKEPTKAESTKELPTKELIKEAQTMPMKIKASELRVQMPTTSALDSSTAPPTTTTPSSATSSVVQSAILSNSLPSPFGSAVNGAVATPSPIKKKLSLSDYKSRMNKAAAKPSLSLISTKSSLAEADEIKLENPIEPAAIEKVESAVTPSAPAATTNGHA
ncbi:hypothetical protein TGAM01_v207493 [Trichoderma gamsii]|uniref:SET domain-containing protein n=1 Tax=Trichoderma gamsii TaxID=398673 RepID=A0A2P4ZGZ0_9HYPO|nr:hypothetical protein TGAM01_v207493 [Trichoderma gamsii]PON23549.1 hypothetical protein TGAM01_v207493 [Trichoderma gamsii]